MKKLLIIVWLAISFIILSRTEYYTRTDCRVIEVNDGYALIVDGGDMWAYECNYLKVGDIVDMKMHTNYTDKYSYDDIIKDVVKK